MKFYFILLLQIIILNKNPLKFLTFFVQKKKEVFFVLIPFHPFCRYMNIFFNVTKNFVRCIDDCVWWWRTTEKTTKHEKINRFNFCFFLWLFIYFKYIGLNSRLNSIFLIREKKTIFGSDVFFPSILRYYFILIFTDAGHGYDDNVHSRATIAIERLGDKSSFIYSLWWTLMVPLN